MKLFSRLLSALACVCCLATLAKPQAAAPPQDPFRYSVVYDFSARDSQPVVGYKATTLPHFLGTKLEPEVWFPVIGAADPKRLNYGGALVFSHPLATNLQGYIGVQARVQDKEKARVGLILGIEFCR